MYCMQSIKARYLQHNLARVLDQVERGETVQVLRRSRPVARIVPVEANGQPRPWPDLLGRLRSIYGQTRIVPPTARLIERDRGEA